MKYQTIAAITASTEKLTLNGTACLELVYEGLYHNKTGLVQRLFLNNANLIAADIACYELAKICKAVDVMSFSDSNRLHNKPMIVCYEVSDTHLIVNSVKPLQTVQIQFETLSRWQMFLRALGIDKADKSWLYRQAFLMEPGK